MSVLETPRILFSGQIAWDPIVTNNATIFYDENSSEPVFPDAQDKVEAFRKEAIAAVAPAKGGFWNPQGTHRSTFYDASITGADLGHGCEHHDAFVGSPARFSGMLVDLEPYGTNSSQLFFDTMTFGIDGGYRIAAKRSTRFIARYVNFNRNPVGYRAGIASVVWQTCFAKDGLTVDAFDSAALKALKRELEDDDDVLGLTVQWNAYRTIYYDNPGIIDKKVLLEESTALIAKLNGGGFQPNPARSMMVGVIGLWRRDEPVHEPCERTLLAQGSETVATAHARLTRDSITLDLSNSIPETGLDLVKKDLGELTVVAIDPKTGEPETLASFGYPQYDTPSYLRTSGIITLHVDRHKAKKAREADLQLRDSGGNILLAEAALRALPLVPNLYINQGDTREVAFQVYDRGEPADAGIDVMICVMSADGSTVESSYTLTTDDDGIVRFPVTGVQGSITQYVPLPGPDPVRPASGIDPQVNTFMYVRTLPADPDVAVLDPSWDNVYARVLANWKAMAPCMDNWLDLANPQQVYSFGAMIQQLTDEAAFENFRFMPVTRDMTAGERTLLYNFLNGPAPKPAVAAAPAALMGEAAPAEPEPANFAKLSRRMRGGE